MNDYLPLNTIIDLTSPALLFAFPVAVLCFALFVSISSDIGRDILPKYPIVGLVATMVLIMSFGYMCIAPYTVDPNPTMRARIETGIFDGDALTYRYEISDRLSLVAYHSPAWSTHGSWNAGQDAVAIEWTFAE